MFVEPNDEENITFNKNITFIISNINNEYLVTGTPLIVKNIGYSGSTDITKSTLPSLPPSNLKVYLYSKRHIKVRWNNPDMLTKTQQIQNFWLEYKAKGEDWSRIALGFNVLSV